MKIRTLSKLVALSRRTIERCTRRHPEAAIVWEGLVIREFMEQHGIDECGEGVREFYAFKRGMIARMGWKKGA